MQKLTLAQRQSLRERLAWKLAYALKPRYFAMRRGRKPWNVTIETLRDMPEGSLGNDLAKFLTANNLEMMPRAEFHDVYHVLFNYGTNIRDEACIQFVPLGNGRWSLPYVTCTMVTILFYPEYLEDFYEAYKKGKAANRFHDIDFEPFLQMPTREVREWIFRRRTA